MGCTVTSEDLEYEQERLKINQQQLNNLLLPQPKEHTAELAIPTGKREAKYVVKPQQEERPHTPNQQSFNEENIRKSQYRSSRASMQEKRGDDKLIAQLMNNMSIQDNCELIDQCDE